MTTDAFGLSDTTPSVQLGLEEEIVEEHETLGAPSETPEEPTVEQSAEAEAPSEEETPSEPEVQEQEVPQATEEVEPEAEVAPPEGPDPYEEWLAQMPEGTQWLGKYNSPDDIVKGYNESREWARRATDARKAAEQQAYETSLREAELAKIVTEAVPYLREAAEREQQVRVWMDQYRQNFGEYPEGYVPRQPQEQKPLGPDDVQRMMAEQRERDRAEMQAQFERQQEYLAVNEAVQGFYVDHPEVEPRGPADNEITDAMQVLNSRWTEDDVDMSDPGSLEILYEASKRPALLEVLAMRPDYFDTEYGLALARREAAFLEGVPDDTPRTRTVPASEVGRTTGQRKPFAESAVSGAEASEEPSDDPWDEIKREVAKSRNTQNVWQFE